VILKLLYVKLTLDKIPEILKFISETFPAVDVVSLNSLIVSEVIKNRGEELIPNRDEIMLSINETLDLARKNNIEALYNYGIFPSA